MPQLHGIFYLKVIDSMGYLNIERVWKAYRVVSNNLGFMLYLVEIKDAKKSVLPKVNFRKVYKLKSIQIPFLGSSP